MKKLLFISLLLLVVCGLEAKTEKKATLWSGETECADDWSAGFVVLPLADLGDIASGDELRVSVSAISATCDWPTVCLQNYSWADFTPSQYYSLSGQTAPCSATYAVTAELLGEIKSTGGLVVKGCGFTMTEISLYGNVEPIEGEDINVWTGSTVMPMNWGAWQQIAASAFADAKEGYLLRMSIADVQAGAQGHLTTSAWGDVPDAGAFVPLSGGYYQFSITEGMLAELKANGVIVTGCGYTLTSVDLINPSNLPKIATTITTDDSDWVWEDENAPVLKLALTNEGTKAVNAKCVVEVKTDKRAYVGTLSKEVALALGGSGEADFALDMIMEPDFYVVTVTVADELVKSFNIGYQPEKIVSAPDKQADFDAFWSESLAALKAVDGQFTLTLIPEKSTAKRNVYLVEMKSIDNGDGVPVTVRGYYAEPVAEGKYPCCLHFMGYDNRDSEYLWCMGGDDNENWCDLIFSHRGQYINNKLHHPEDDIYDNYFAYHFGDKDTYYYRGAYLDCVRAIDFVCSRDRVDERNIFAQGSSQGGALTIAAAALDTRIRAIAPSIQFMGDFPDYFQVAQWPASVARECQTALGLTDAEMYAFLSYFDTKNLATRISCPVTTSIGLQDDVCPAHTNMAPINNLQSEKVEILYNPGLKHEVPGDWWNRFFEFFKENMDITTVVEVDGWRGVKCDEGVYNLMGQAVSSDFRGVTIRNGRKYVVR